MTGGGGSSRTKIKVAVRVRPFNKREVDLDTECIVEMNETCTSLMAPNASACKDKKNTKRFHFDNCFDSIDPLSANFSDQSFVFEELGLDLLDNAFQGYNACIFAYGQTGSGKSYTMMGSIEKEPGIIPRLCHELFSRICSNTNDAIQFKVEMSYMEIYNEKVHDLLDPRAARKSNLKVREHKIFGPYVDGLSKLAVTSGEDIYELIEIGNRSRTVAATNMNAESSRSHAVFTIVLSQQITNFSNKLTGEKVSRISLVDLAGSERATKTGAAGDRLKEGSNINRSLTTLGLVISALADQSSPSKKRQAFVPYRDSTLTWLLKDSLGGNSKTVMIATISPAADNYDETLSTLRYADRAKRIVNNAVINEDPNAKIIRELREEIEMLKRQLADALNASKRKASGGSGSNSSAHLAPNLDPGGWNVRGGSTGGYSDDSENEDSVAKALLDQLAESEKLVQQMSLTWEEKVELSEAITKDRQGALHNMGLNRLGGPDMYSSTGSLDELNPNRRKSGRNKIYIINLHSDPLLNEMLMYPLKKHTTVGREDSMNPPDIHLTGLGMHKNHCMFEIYDNDVHLVPSEGARTCVNGEEIQSMTILKHCDRILFGNNHIFRINCPATNKSQSMGLSQGVDVTKFDYEFARNELLENSIASESVAQMMNKLESAFCQDKEDAVARQRALYERHISMLQGQLSPQQLAHINWENFNSLIGPSNQSYNDWIEKQDEAFKSGLRRLKESLTETLSLSKEAESMAKEMCKKTTYKVTLQIPPYNLTPNRRLIYGNSNGGLLCEPAVVVRRKGRPPCIWNLSKLDNRIIEMRDLYSDWKSIKASTDNLDTIDDEEGVANGGSDEDHTEGVLSLYDPFFEVQDNHDLIGVANVFLECLFYDVTLCHQVPIINQQGEVSGKLKIEMSKLSGSLHGYRMADAGAASLESESQSGSSSDADQSNVFSTSDQTPESPPSNDANTVSCKLKISDAQGLPASTAHFVFCTFEFYGQEWEEPVTVVQKLDPEKSKEESTTGDIVFQYEGEFKLNVTEELLEYCAEGSLAIEIYGHRKHKRTGASGDDGEQMTSSNSEQDSVACLHDSITQKNKHLIDKWNEVKSAIEMWVEIQEINDQGEFAPVDVLGKQDVPTGGVYQLKQGHTRHIKVMVSTPTNEKAGDLPLVIDSVVGVQIGSVTLANKSQPSLDSFQDDDLTRLRSRWADALSRRKQHLEEQLKEINLKSEKDEADLEREVVLLDQWVSLTEERNAVLVPAPGSSIPGAKSLWNPMPGMETSKTVLFLDLDPLEMMPVDGNVLACANSFLPKESGSRFFPLSIIDRASEPEVSCVVTWDSSVHNESCLNKPTLGGDRIYLILKVFLHLSMPAPMDIVLRKRLCCVIYKRPSITSVVRKKFFGTGLALTGVTFQVVSHIPQSSEDIETRESLALLAASSIEKEGYEGLEKYTQSLSSVESLLTFDRLKQEVAILEAMKKSGISLRQQALDLPVFLPLLKVGSSCTGSEEDSRMGLVADNASPMWSPASSMTSLNSLAMGSQMMDDRQSPHLGMSGSGYRSRTGSFRRHSLTPSAMRRCTSWGYHNKYGPLHFTRENSVQSLAGAPTMGPMIDVDSGDSMSQTRRGRSVRKTNSPGAVGIGSSQTLRGVNYRGLGPSSATANGVPMISERPEHRNSASFSSQGNAEYRRSVSSAIASAENLEHKPEDSFSMSQEQLLPVIAIENFENEEGATDLDQPKTRRSSSPSRLMCTDPQNSASTDTLVASDSGRGSRSSHLLKVGGSSGGSDYKNSRPQSPRLMNSPRMTTLEEQEENGSSGPAVRKTEVHRSYSANTEEVNPALNENDESEPNEKKEVRPLGEGARGASLDSIPQWVKPGVSVRVGQNKKGTVRYCGRTHFSEGVMVGVSLDSPHGRHDGSVDGVRYFQCLPNHGVFVKADRLEMIPSPMPSTISTQRPASNTKTVDTSNSAFGPPSSSNITLRSTLAARKSAKALSEKRKSGVAAAKGI